MTSDKLFYGVEIISVSGVIPNEIESISDHSEKIDKNCLFFCRKGNNDDGAKYAVEAIRRGAVAIVAEKPIECGVCVIVVKDSYEAMAVIAKNFYGDFKGKIKTVGLVGTNGKTSTCHFIRQTLEAYGKNVAVVGTIGNYICGKKYDGELTTPGLFELYRLIDLSIKEGAEVFVVEISAHAIYQKRTEGIYFDFLIFTNCTEDHLDYFKTFEAYSNVKKSIFYDGYYGKAIICADDKTGREIIKGISRPFVLYGIDKKCDFYADEIKESLSGNDFILSIYGKKYKVNLPLIGLFNVYNILAAVSCATELGVPLSFSVEFISEIKPVDGRLNYLGLVNGGRVFVDYAHTPDGLLKTLSSLKKVCEGNLYCVFGCGGNREREKRKIMGEISARFCDFTIITDDNPRFEKGDEIRKEIERGVKNFCGKYISLGDRREAVCFGINLLKKGDLLVVAGKGAEKYQEIQGEKYPFDELKEVEKIIIEKGGKIPG